MAESPLLNSGNVVRLEIRANGSQIKDSIGVASVSVNKTVNEIPYARIELLDGDASQQDFPISNSEDFKPGSEIRIDASYGLEKETIFEGIIVKQGIRVAGGSDSRLIIECSDKALKLTLGRRNANFLEKTDSDIIGRLITEAGLKKDVHTTALKYEKMVQYYCSDWDFLMSRAEANGLLVITDGGKVSVNPPDTKTAAALKLTYGTDLIELHADVDASTQLSMVGSSCWDPENQALARDSAPASELNKQGDLTSEELAKVLGIEEFHLQTPAALRPQDLQTWAEAQQVKAGLARIRGRMKFQGSARARPGTLIELEGVGDHFNGDVFVSSVTHQIEEGNWITEAEFGLAPGWYAEQRNLVAPPASGLLPGVDGLQIGKVVKIDEDPDKSYRIQIKLPLLDEGGVEAEPLWARLASFYATQANGAFFLPEVDDEVVIGFLNGDPTQPIVLGSLFSAKSQAPYEADDKNTIKGIITRSELKFEFNEERKSITLATPAGNQLMLDDDAGSILLQDRNGNKISLSESGIALDSPGDISIKAGGKIDISATADADIKGMNVSCDARVGFTARGSASAELSAAGQTTVKGAMVMIN